MRAFLLRRLLGGLASVIVVTIVVFSVIHLIPGDPAVMILGMDATPDALAQVRKELGLDLPLLVQYVRWLQGVLSGNLGRSIFGAQQPVADLIRERFPATVPLLASSVLMAVGIAIPAGVLAAVKRNTWVDGLIGVLTFVGISLPRFWLGLLLIMLVSLRWGLLPAGGYASITEAPLEALKRLVLPTIALGWGMSCALTRMVRSGVLEVLGLDYIRTARAKGLPERAVVFRHALRNALIPAVTILGIQIGFVVGGQVAVEEVFAWPGMGQLLVGSVFTRDFPIVQGVALMLGVLYVFINFLTDICYGILDPRIRYG